jgi:hypothetical protein
VDEISTPVQCHCKVRVTHALGWRMQVNQSVIPNILPRLGCQTSFSRGTARYRTVPTSISQERARGRTGPGDSYHHVANARCLQGQRHPSTACELRCNLVLTMRSTVLQMPSDSSTRSTLATAVPLPAVLCRPLAFPLVPDLNGVAECKYSAVAWASDIVPCCSLFPTSAGAVPYESCMPVLFHDRLEGYLRRRYDRCVWRVVATCCCAPNSYMATRWHGWCIIHLKWCFFWLAHSISFSSPSPPPQGFAPVSFSSFLCPQSSVLEREARARDKREILLNRYPLISKV